MQPALQTLPPYLFLGVLELVLPLHGGVEACLGKPGLDLEQAQAHPQAPTAGWLRQVPLTLPLPKQVAQGGEQKAQQLLGQRPLPGHVPESLAHVLARLAVPRQQLLTVLHVLLPPGLGEQLCQASQVPAQHQPLELGVRASVGTGKHLRVCTTATPIPFPCYCSSRK